MLIMVLCSNPYNDPDAIRFTQTDLQQGSLNSVSFARPMKLFTANESLMTKSVAILNNDIFKAILTATIGTLQKNIPQEL